MTTLILLPGLLCDARLWAHQREALSDLAQVVVGDLTVDDSIGAMAERVLAAAPPRFALAGLSMGGYVSFEIVRRAPERVERLALVSTTARPDTPEQTQRRKDAIALTRAGEFGKVVPSVLAALMTPANLDDPAIGGLARDMARVVGPEGFVRQQTAIMGRPDSRPTLAAIRCPTLVVCGRDDTLTPLDRAEEMASGVPGGRLAVVEHCAHLSAIERPAEVSAAMRQWLTGG
ncbi:MAG: alpha/beta fold hydrolase [Actinomycetota bacterium]